MLDFTPVRAKEISYAEFVKDLTVDDLRALTNEMVDRQLELIADCTDADVVFQPIDEQAHDSYATNPDETAIAWTLGHVIVHATASSEEAAYLAVELARGLPPREGRSRYETPWETVTTMAQCRARLAESRRMRLASLDMWPDEPFYDNRVDLYDGRVPGANAVVRFVLGLSHDTNHLGQIEEIVRQATAARAAETTA